MKINETEDENTSSQKKILCNHIFNLENNDGIVFEKEFNFLNDSKLG